tara:strand:- start:102 stop:338 length:237 start_codon:yes stop_codon:yes gene_type:complete
MIKSSFFTNNFCINLKLVYTLKKRINEFWGTSAAHAAEKPYVEGLRPPRQGGGRQFKSDRDYQLQTPLYRGFCYFGKK